MIFTIIYIFLSSISFSLDRTTDYANKHMHKIERSWKGRLVGFDSSKNFVILPIKQKFKGVLDIFSNSSKELVGAEESSEIPTPDNDWPSLLSLTVVSAVKSVVSPVSSIDIGLVLRDNYIFDNGFMFSMEYRWQKIVSSINHIANFINSLFRKDLLNKTIKHDNGITIKARVLNRDISLILLLFNSIPEFRFKFPIMVNDRLRFVPGVFLRNIINVGANVGYEFMINNDTFLNIEVGFIVLDSLSILLENIVKLKYTIGPNIAFTSSYFLVGFSFRI